MSVRKCSVKTIHNTISGTALLCFIFCIPSAHRRHECSAPAASAAFPPAVRATSELRRLLYTHFSDLATNIFRLIVRLFEYILFLFMLSIYLCLFFQIFSFHAQFSIPCAYHSHQKIQKNRSQIGAHMKQYRENKQFPALIQHCQNDRHWKCIDHLDRIAMVHCKQK